MSSTYQARFRREQQDTPFPRPCYELRLPCHLRNEPVIAATIQGRPWSPWFEYRYTYVRLEYQCQINVDARGLDFNLVITPRPWRPPRTHAARQHTENQEAELPIKTCGELRFSTLPGWCQAVKGVLYYRSLPKRRTIVVDGRRRRRWTSSYEGMVNESWFAKRLRDDRTDIAPFQSLPYEPHDRFEYVPPKDAYDLRARARLHVPSGVLHRPFTGHDIESLVHLTPGFHWPGGRAKIEFPQQDTRSRT